MSLVVLACADRWSEGRAAAWAAGSPDSQASILAALGSYYADFSARNIASWQGIDAFTLIWHDGRWRTTSLVYTDE